MNDNCSSGAAEGARVPLNAQQALAKLMVSIMRADGHVRPEEIFVAMDRISLRFGMPRAEGSKLVWEALDLAEHVHTLRSCLDLAGARQMPENLLSDLSAIAWADGIYHDNEDILISGISNMLWQSGGQKIL